MVARVRELPLTGVVGPSGVGKSSFVRAGVVPALKASGERWEVFTLRPGRNPLAALAERDPAADRARQRAQSRWSSTRRHLLRRARLPRRRCCVRARARPTRTTVVHRSARGAVHARARRRATPRVHRRARRGRRRRRPHRYASSCRCARIFSTAIGEDTRFTDDLSRGLVFLATAGRAGLREALVQPIELVGYRFETRHDRGDARRRSPAHRARCRCSSSRRRKLWDARDRERRLVTARATPRSAGSAARWPRTPTTSSRR